MCAAQCVAVSDAVHVAVCVAVCVAECVAVCAAQCVAVSDAVHVAVCAAKVFQSHIASIFLFASLIIFLAKSNINIHEKKLNHDNMLAALFVAVCVAVCVVVCVAVCVGVCGAVCGKFCEQHIARIFLFGFLWDNKLRLYSISTVPGGVVQTKICRTNLKGLDPDSNLLCIPRFLFASLRWKQI